MLMPQRKTVSSTALGDARRVHRGAIDGDIAATGSGNPASTFYRLECSTHRPSYDTAFKLAAWLGWTTGPIMKAADQHARAAVDHS